MNFAIDFNEAKLSPSDITSSNPGIIQQLPRTRALEDIVVRRTHVMRLLYVCLSAEILKKTQAFCGHSKTS